MLVTNLWGAVLSSSGDYKRQPGSGSQRRPLRRQAIIDDASGNVGAGGFVTNHVDARSHRKHILDGVDLGRRTQQRLHHRRRIGLVEANPGITDELARRRHPARARGFNQNAVAIAVDERKVHCSFVHVLCGFCVEDHAAIYPLRVSNHAVKRCCRLDRSLDHDQLAVASRVERGELDLTGCELPELAAQQRSPNLLAGHDRARRTCGKSFPQHADEHRRNRKRTDQRRRRRAPYRARNHIVRASYLWR